MKRTIGPVVIDPARRTVSRLDGSVVPLTGAEWRLFARLVEAQGEPVHAGRLLPAVLGREWHVEDRSISQLVLNLRRKLPRDDDGLSLVRLDRGLGYWVRAAGQPCPSPPQASVTPTGVARFGQAAQPAPVTARLLDELAACHAVVTLGALLRSRHLPTDTPFRGGDGAPQRARRRVAMRLILRRLPDLLAAARAGIAAP